MEPRQRPSTSYVLRRDQLQCANHRLNLFLFLVDAHWCAVEIDRRTEPIHVVVIQWPPELHATVTLEVSRILQIPPHRLLVTHDSTNEVFTICGWTILFRWYVNFAMQACLQPMIHVSAPNQVHLDRVIHRAQQQWRQTNASESLKQFASECRQAFMSECARGNPDTRLPPDVSTTMFVGPKPEYVQEVCRIPRPPTNREQEIQRLRTMLIQPAWLTNFEVELLLRAIRLQALDRFLPGPLHFDTYSETLEPFTSEPPSIARYAKVLFFVTMNYHWITISGTMHQNRWLLTAAVPDPQSRYMSKQLPHSHRYICVDGPFYTRFMSILQCQFLMIQPFRCNE